MKPFKLFTLFGITTSMTLVSVGSFALCGIALAWLATSQSGLNAGEGWLVGLLCVLVMFLGDWLHDMGHAWAARRVGHPMTGIKYFSILAQCEYPKNEPQLPGKIHIQRALGGFWVNLLIGGVAFFLLLYGPLWPAWAFWVLGFTAFYNFVILGLGALIPPIDIPGYFQNDGGTILKHLRGK